MGFVFYDTETTGTDTTYDQILQFAAILTGDDLRELDRFEIRCRLLPHVIPAPGALLATRVTPAMLTNPSLPSHYQAMRQVADKLNAWSPAIFIGYNTLGFDESLLRQAFYQTLQPVYLTNTHGNKRGDVMRLAQATAVLAPNAMAVPLNDKGKPTLKLDTLAPANGFAHENAHDALADVEATIYMARHIRDRAPAVWASLMPMVDKADVTARVLSGRPHCLTEYHMGRPTARPVIGCGQSAANPTMLGTFDLTRDPAGVIGLGVEDLIKNMSGADRAIRTVYANKMPAVTELELVPDAERTLGLPTEVVRQRAEQVMNAGAFHQRVALALAQRFPPREPSLIVEERIYEGFPGRADERRMAAFHGAGGAERAELVETFEDDRVRELGRRLVYFENPDDLLPPCRVQLDTWLGNRRHGREGATAGRTIGDAQAELDEIASSSSEHRPEIDEINNFLAGQL
jgi:exodeoxyribonuclease-1